MLTGDFDLDGGSYLNINYNIVSVFPHEYYQETEVGDPEEAYEVEMMKHKPMSYYVLNNVTVK